MALARVKGQSVEISMVLGGQVQQSINSVTSFSIEAEMEMMSVGFLGEKSERKDDIYKGVKGKLSIQIASEGVFEVIRAIVDRAKERNPGVKIVIKATLNLPNGETPRIIIPDCYFGPIPVDVGSRSDYVKTDLDFGAEDFTVLY